MRAALALVALLALAAAFRETFFFALGVITYLYLLYVALELVAFHAKVLKAGRSSEHYAEEVVAELKALVKAIHLLKAKKARTQPS